jgi:osmotically inducible protein OsmC
MLMGGSSSAGSAPSARLRAAVLDEAEVLGREVRVERELELAQATAGAPMTKPLYTAQARVSGGRQHGHGRTTDGALDVQLRPPKELGGFEAAMLLAAQRAKVPVEQVADATIDAKVMLVPASERALELAVELAVALPAVDDHDQAAEIVRIAHGICPYSNATRGNVDVALSVNGLLV